MAFEWDEAKRLANIEKHGIDFDDANEMFDGHVVETEDFGARLWRTAYPRLWSIGNQSHSNRLHAAQRPPPDHQRKKGRTR